MKRAERKCRKAILIMGVLFGILGYISIVVFDAFPAPEGRSEPPLAEETTDLCVISDPALWRAKNSGGLGMLEQDDWMEQGLTLIAHRGYSSEFPENTMPAFEGALDVGVDYIETDVQMTKDGRLVLFHDNDLLRITGVEGVISDKTYAELSMMDAGAWFDSAYEGVHIPTLEELLILLRDSECKIYLELKDIGDIDGFVEEVYKQVKQYESWIGVYLRLFVILIWNV